MMKNLSILIVVFTTLALTSCKQEQIDFDNIAVSAEDQTRMENEFASVFDYVDQVANDDPDISGRTSGESSSFLPDCADANFDLPSSTLTIDFGNDGCLCDDGRERKGKIVAVFDGLYRTEGTTVTVDLVNYFVEDVQFTGTKVITNLGNDSGNFKYSYEVTGASAITPSGTISWNTLATLERIEGEGTLTPWDDVYLITGSSEGVNRQGVDFSMNSLTPLKKKMMLGCLRNFVSGELRLTDDAGNEIDLDYDPFEDEACDKIARITINGSFTLNITLW